MAPLSNYVSLTITRDSLGITKPGFGKALFLSATAAWSPDRVRVYDDLAGVLEDFSSTTGPEYLTAQAYFSQSPHPSQFYIGRSALPPTQKYELSAAAVRNSHLYSIAVAGDGVTSGNAGYTSDSGATAQEIHNGLLTALNAITGKNYLATFALLGAYTSAFTTTHAAETLQITAHGQQTGSGPYQLTNSGGALPAGFSALTDYYAIRVDADNLQLASSLANALAGTAVAISGNGTGTHTITASAGALIPYTGIVVTGSAAGEWFSLSGSLDDITIAQTHADPGVATDLAAIAVENNDWYCLLTAYNSDAYVKAAAAWVSSNKKIYVWDGNDSVYATGADADSDTIDDLQGLDYSRVHSAYKGTPSEFYSAGLAGRNLPIEPGGETWAFKTVVGSTADNLTSTQRTHLTSKNGNGYESVGGVSRSFEGKTSDGDYLDIQRGLDWLEADMTAAVFTAMGRNNKLPFTDAGVAVIKNEVRGSLLRAVQKGILAEDPAPVVTAPLVADIASSDKALRQLPDVKFSGTLAGAIHKVIITGVVSV